MTITVEGVGLVTGQTTDCYPKGIIVSGQAMAAINLGGDDVHSEHRSRD